MLDDSKSGASRLGRELLATAINPVRGLDRVLTGKAWSTGLPPERRPMRVALNLGLDRVRLEDYGGVEGRRNLDPSLLAAFQIEYGDLRPAAGKDTLGPFETFDLYAAVNLFQANLTGAQVFEHGLLYGFSHDLTEDTDEGRDNNVFGFFQSFDFQGANLATFGALGVGPGEHLVYRTKNLGHIHVGLAVEWVPVFGLTSDNVGPLRKYNIVTGGSAGLYADWDFGRPGRLQLRAKNYFGAIADGAQGFEYVGYTRLAYEIDILRGLMGVGLAPLTIQRGSRYREGPQESGTQASTQLYFVVHN